MKVCIPIETKPQGGGFYFIDNLRRYLEAHDIEHTQALEDHYDILFLNSWHVTYHQVMRAWRANPQVRLVHRVDGAARDYGRHDHVDAVQRRVSHLADRTVFQSEYCRYSTREKFSVITQDGPVIWNPVDIETFTSSGPRRSLPGKIRVCYTTFSTNPMKGAPELFQVAACQADVSFIACGRYDDPPDLPNLHLMGLLGRAELAEIMRSCDVLLTFARNEACPNVVLEGLASGIPVLYLDSGAAPELVQACGLPVTVSTFRTQLESVLSNQASYAARARQRALEQFHPEIVFPRYIAVMEQALTAPPRVSLSRRRLLTGLARVIEPAEMAWQSTRPLRKRIRGKLRALTSSSR